MRRAIQSLVSRQPALTHAQSLPVIRLVDPYVCFDCRRYLLEGLLPREEWGSAVVGGGGSGLARQQQQRGIHATARNLRGSRGGKKVRKNKIDWDGLEGFRSQKGQTEDVGEGEGEVWSTGPDRVRLRKVNLTPDQQRYINERTATFSQLRDESDVGSPDSVGTKLVDNRAYIASTKLWRTLLDFKRRLYHDEGVKDIWSGMKIRGIDLPIEGSGADLMWGIFLKTALRDEAFMEEMWVYIQDYDYRLKYRPNWPGMYDTIVGHFLINDPPNASTWHYRLYPRHYSQSWAELFATVLQQRSDVQPRLREIHATVRKPAGAYAGVIPTLCNMGLHQDALKWHRHLLSFDDLPEDTSCADELIKWMGKYGSVHELHRLLHSFVETGVKVAESSLMNIMVARPDKLEALRFILARSNEFDRAVMGDRFWALVISQTNIERADVYRYLETFGTGLVVGRETVGAIMERFELPEDKAAWVLAGIGMTFQEAEAVQPPPEEPAKDKPTEEDGAESTKTIPTPVPPPPKQKRDFQGRRITEHGPSTMDDLAASLSEFLKNQDWDNFDRTLDFPSPGLPDVRIHNLLLQSDLHRGNFRGAIHRVERMRLSSIAVSTPSLRLLIATLLHPRRRGHNPLTQPNFNYVEDDVFLIIGILFSLLRSGTTEVDPTLWREIFKRLGMARRLTDIEALATGLVEWYHPERSITTRRRLARTVTVPSTADSPIAAAPPDLLSQQWKPVKIPERSRENPLRKLFPKHFVAAVVMWGFLTFRPYSAKTTPLIPPPPNPDTRVFPVRYGELRGCVSNFTWGVGLARKLVDLGVYVEPRVVVRAVRVRLGPVFDIPEEMMTPKRINRVASMLNYLTLQQVVDIVEAAWGGGLYRREGWEQVQEVVNVQGTEIMEGVEKAEGTEAAVNLEEAVKAEKFNRGEEEKRVLKRSEREEAMRVEIFGRGVPRVRFRRRQRVVGGKRRMRLRMTRSEV